MKNWVPSRVACEILGIHPNTLRKWADDGTIETFRTPANQRRYNVEAYLKKGGEPSRRRIVYARVSSRKQKDDFINQVAQLRGRYPDYEVLEDYGSGLNFKRKGLTSLLDSILSGDVGEVVVAHRDRLCRFGFELFEQIATKHNCRIVVLNDTELSPEQELVQDIVSILHVFSRRLYGLRKYHRQVKQDTTLPKASVEAEDEAISGIESVLV